MKYLNIFGALILSAVFSLCVVSCGDDNDSPLSTAKIAGTWMCSEYISSDGEIHSTSHYYILSEDGFYKEYFSEKNYISDKEYYSGKWRAADNKLSLMSEYYHHSSGEIYPDEDTETYEIQKIEDKRMTLYEVSYREVWVWNRLD